MTQAWATRSPTNWAIFMPSWSEEARQEGGGGGADPLVRGLASHGILNPAIEFNDDPIERRLPGGNRTEEALN